MGLGNCTFICSCEPPCSSTNTQGHSSPKASALAIPSAWNALQQVSEWLTSLPTSSLCCNVISVSPVPHWPLYLILHTPSSQYSYPCCRNFLQHHLSLSNILYNLLIVLFPACLPLLECKNHEGRHFCLMCSLKYSHHLQQCLAHSRHVAVSIDTAELIDKPSPQPYKDDCYYPHFKASETHRLFCTKSITGEWPSWDSKPQCLLSGEERKEEEVKHASPILDSPRSTLPTSNRNRHGLCLLPRHWKIVEVTGWRPPLPLLLVLPTV